MVLGPICTRAELVDAGGEPVTRSALSPVSVEMRYPVARRLVEETEARLDWPEMFRVAPWKYPDAVTLVPDAFVKFRVGKTPYPEAVMFVLDTEPSVVWPPTAR